MFQRQVNLQPALAVAGDFASSNPRASVLAGAGALVAGAAGLTVGFAAWLDAAGVVASNYGTAPAAPNGFVHREQQALITAWLGETSNLVPAGLPVTLMNKGDFWATNSGSASTAIGDLLYARYSDGALANAIQTGATVTGSMGSTSTAAIGATFTASAGGDTTQLVVTSVTGYIAIGDKVSGTGITAGTTITGQVSGTANGAGTYQLSATNSASSATVTSFGTTLKTSAVTGLISIGETVSGGAGFPTAATVVAQVSGTAGGVGVYTLSAPATAYVASATGVTTFGNVANVTAITSGTLAVGDPISGTGVPANASIASQTSGTVGGIGVYTLNKSATAYAASTTLTAVAGVVTTWKAASVAAPGELMKFTM